MISVVNKSRSGGINIPFGVGGNHQKPSNQTWLKVVSSGEWNQRWRGMEEETVDLIMRMSALFDF